MKLKTKDVESYENKKQRTLSPVKLKGEDVESYENIKQRTLSPGKHKREDVESYETKKQRTLSPVKHKDRRYWVLLNMSIGTSTQGLNLIRNQDVDSLKGPFKR